MDGRMNGRRGGWAEGQMDERMDGWMNGRTKRFEEMTRTRGKRKKKRKKEKKKEQEKTRKTRKTGWKSFAEWQNIITKNSNNRRL